jgi:DNA-directed RNA polymerase I, II, and III subunit RPABC4
MSSIQPTTTASASTNQPSDFTLEKPVTYTCGDCAADVSLKRADPLRCLQCGHRILHKKRTTRMVQFEAR